MVVMYAVDNISAEENETKQNKIDVHMRKMDVIVKLCGVQTFAIAVTRL
jgi:hypothetical protein